MRMVGAITRKQNNHSIQQTTWCVIIFKIFLRIGKKRGVSMKTYKVYADLDYVSGYLRYGHLEGEIKCESEEELKEMIKKGTIRHHLEVEVDDFSVEDYGDIGEYEYELVEEQEDITVPIAVHRQVQWDRDVAIDQLHSYGVEFGEKAELQKVRHGHWIMDKDYVDGKIAFVYSCSECGKFAYSQYKFCPECGVKMDGRVERGI